MGQSPCPVTSLMVGQVAHVHELSSSCLACYRQVAKPLALMTLLLSSPNQRFLTSKELFPRRHLTSSGSGPNSSVLSGYPERMDLENPVSFLANKIRSIRVELKKAK